MNNRIGRSSKKSKSSIDQSTPAAIPAATLPGDTMFQLSPMQAQVMTRVMNDNADHRVNDLIVSHGDIADAVIAGMLAGGLGEQFQADQKNALYGLMKLCFLWGVRAREEDWAGRYNQK